MSPNQASTPQAHQLHQYQPKESQKQPILTPPSNMSNNQSNQYHPTFQPSTGDSANMHGMPNYNQQMSQNHQLSSLA